MGGSRALVTCRRADGTMFYVNDKEIAMHLVALIAAPRPPVDDVAVFVPAAVASRTEVVETALEAQRLICDLTGQTHHNLGVAALHARDRLPPDLSKAARRLRRLANDAKHDWPSDGGTSGWDHGGGNLSGDGCGDHSGTSDETHIDSDGRHRCTTATISSARQRTTTLTAHDDPVRSAAHGDQLRTTEHDDQQRTAAHKDLQRTAAHDNLPRTTVRGDQPHTAAHDDQQRSAALDDQRRTSAHDDQAHDDLLSQGAETRETSDGGVKW
eukprot:CAMPEP_0203856582 /NCGR_PEP_ID=MMETSP0359-20131031/10255_1 /ASSEMBLY_ACC=CAM_ASM_000338 /TAXON_ID=268821 /ORGANISM="Scrippsiella Hangoei, Strain SHTV-5" /LENGTH=268 /DNA_ID=CAMNT_0050773207 /DNA_START=77 /DNA_END=880 /DNA_ORIENTATION=+